MCHKSGTAKVVLSILPQENWKGLGKPGSPQGLYLGNKKNIIRSALAWENKQNMPILRNGGNIDLQGLKIGNGNYSLRNTCAFDSVFQIILAAAFDDEKLKKAVIQFFNLAFDSRQQKMTLKKYKT